MQWLKILWLAVTVFGCKNALAQTFTTYEIQMVEFVESLSSVGDYNYFTPYEKNEIDSAVKWLNSLSQDERFKDYQVWFYFNRGRLLLVQKNYESAKLDLEHAIKLDSLNSDVMDRICVLSAHLKNYTNRKFYLRSGVAGYEQKLKTDSSNVMDWYCYAQFLDLQSQFTSKHNIVKQRYALAKCVQLDSTNANYWYELSLCYYSVPEKRIKYLNKAISLRESTLYRDHVIAALSQGSSKDLVKSIEYTSLCIDLYKEKYPDNLSFIKHLYELRADFYKEMGNIKMRNADLKSARDLK